MTPLLVAIGLVNLADLVILIVLTWAPDSLDISVADRSGERTAAAGPPGQTSETMTP